MANLNRKLKNLPILSMSNIFLAPNVVQSTTLQHCAFALKSGLAGGHSFLSFLHPCGAKYNVALKSGLAGGHSECKTNKLQ